MRITGGQLRRLIKEELESAKLSEYDAREDAPEPPLTLAEALEALKSIRQLIDARFAPWRGVIKFETAMFNPPGGEQLDASAERDSHAATLKLIQRIQNEVNLLLARLPVQTERE